MKDLDIAAVFEAITSEADGARTANAVRARIAPRNSQRRIGRARIGIVAACIAFSLVLSLGVYAVYRSSSIRVPDSGPFDYIVQVNTGEDQAGSNASEMLTLSAALMAEAKTYCFDASSGQSIYESGKIFASWEDAARWLDCGLLTSEKLGNLPDAVVWGGEIVLVSFCAPDGELRCIQLTGTNEIIGEDAACQTTVIIPLSGEWEQYGVAASVSQSSQARVNENGVLALPDAQASGSSAVTSFTTASGNQAQVAVIKNGNVCCATGHLMENGIIYSFSVRHAEETAALDLVKNIIDSLRIR